MCKSSNSNKSIPQAESILLEGTINPPTGLKQRNLDDTEIGLIGTSKSDTVKIGAEIAYDTINRCAWDYTLEVEVVLNPGRFQGRPTHWETITKPGSDGAGQEFVEVIVTGLLLGKYYRWRVRRVILSYWASIDNGQLRCISPRSHTSEWIPGGGIVPSATFRTPVPYQNVIEYPSELEVVTGGLLSGNEESLRVDDGNDYRVASVNTGNDETEWHASLTNITPQSRNAKIRIRSRTTRNCNETLFVWLSSQNRWQQLESGSSTFTEREWTASIPKLFNYLDDGVLRFKVTCSTSDGGFRHRTDLFEVSYERAMVPWAADDPELAISED